MGIMNINTVNNDIHLVEGIKKAMNYPDNFTAVEPRSRSPMTTNDNDISHFFLFLGKLLIIIIIIITATTKKK